MADPAGFDHFRGGEPVPGLYGADPTGFDYFRSGESALLLEPPPPVEDNVTADTVTASFVVASASAIEVPSQYLFSTARIHRSLTATVRVAQTNARAAKIKTALEAEVGI